MMGWDASVMSLELRQSKRYTYLDGKLYWVKFWSDIGAWNIKFYEFCFSKPHCCPLIVQN